MKKIFFLLFICFLKLNAYEYLIFERHQTEGQQSYLSLEQFYTDSNGILQLKNISLEGNITYRIPNTSWYSTFYNIKRSLSTSAYSYISRENFYNLYSNDLNFLNDLYFQATNIFLNYLYNDSQFNSDLYIDYNNYELFYNEDGLAVESKVDGIYKGLYDDIGQSGILYNSIGEVVLVDGVEPSFLTKQWLKLQNKIINPLLSVFSISNIWKNILCVVVILASLRMLIRYAFKAFLIRLYSKRIKHYENTITRIENA